MCLVFGISIDQFCSDFKLCHFLDEARSQELEITTIAFNAIIDSSATQCSTLVVTEKLCSVEVRERCSMGFGIVLAARDDWASGFGK